jgi:hypothetical protein
MRCTGDSLLVKLRTYLLPVRSVVRDTEDVVSTGTVVFFPNELQIGRQNPTTD